MFRRGATLVDPLALKQTKHERNAATTLSWFVAVGRICYRIAASVAVGLQHHHGAAWGLWGSWCHCMGPRAQPERVLISCREGELQQPTCVIWSPADSPGLCWCHSPGRIFFLAPPPIAPPSKKLVHPRPTHPFPHRPRVSGRQRHIYANGSNCFWDYKSRD